MEKPSTLFGISLVCRVLFLLFHARDFEAQRFNFNFALQKSRKNSFDSVDGEMETQPGIGGMASTHVPDPIQVWKVLDFIVS